MENNTNTYICGICGQTFGGFPAISRKDNITEICPNCGRLEAVEAYTEKKDGGADPVI